MPRLGEFTESASRRSSRMDKNTTLCALFFNNLTELADMLSVDCALVALGLDQIQVARYDDTPIDPSITSVGIISDDREALPCLEGSQN